MKRRGHLVGVFGLASAVLVGCATTPTTCYPHVYLDGSYTIRGTYLAADPANRGDCYHFVYRDGRTIRVDYRKGGRLSPDPAFGVATIIIEYAEGAQKRRYHNATGQPSPNANGVAAVELRYDEHGRPIEWKGFGVDEQLTEDKRSGLAIVRWTYDEDGHTVEQRHFGSDAQLRDDQHRGVAIVRWKYDEHGNTVEERYLGADERLKEDQLRGVAIVRWTYGEGGKSVEERYLGPDEQLQEDTPRGVAIIRWTYGERGLVEERYFGTDGQLKEDQHRGAAIVRWEYDRQEGKLRTLMFDKHRTPLKESPSP